MVEVLQAKAKGELNFDDEASSPRASHASAHAASHAPPRRLRAQDGEGRSSEELLLNTAELPIRAVPRDASSVFLCSYIS